MQQPSKDTIGTIASKGAPPPSEVANIEFSHTEEGDLVLIFRGVTHDRQLRSAFRELGKNAHDWAREFREPTASKSGIITGPVTEEELVEQDKIK